MFPVTSILIRPVSPSFRPAPALTGPRGRAYNFGGSCMAVVQSVDREGAPAAPGSPSDVPTRRALVGRRECAVNPPPLWGATHFAFALSHSRPCPSMGASVGAASVSASCFLSLGWSGLTTQADQRFVEFCVLTISVFFNQFRISRQPHQLISEDRHARSDLLIGAASGDRRRLAVAPRGVPRG